jgi:tRNA pseudouridine55 synthase
VVLDTSAIIADARMAGKVFSGSIDDYPDGIIIPVDKPYRWTSADVVRKIKWAACKHFGKKNLKVGHAGTLDPLATGVLLVCVGKACRLAETLQKEEKEYVAGISFGATTPSYDLEKAVDKLYPVDNVSEKTVLELLPRFIGEQEQVAPLFSAKSVDGVRAYELARKQFKDKGLAKTDVIEGFDHSVAETLNVQKINIYDLELLAFEAGAPLNLGLVRSQRSENGWDTVNLGRTQPQRSEDGLGPGSAVSQPANVAKGPDGRINVADTSGLDLPLATIRISCSKGTYIRALARDLGEALGSGAHLNSLRRTKTGGFDAETALSVSQAVRLFPTRNQEKPDGQDN